MKTVDCRGMACPQPVVAVKHMLEESKGEPINVMLDDGAPRENVTRFAVNRGFSVAETAINGAYSLLISGEAGEPMVTVESRSGKTVMLVASDRLGDGPEELGRLLMKNFIITLLDQDEVPDLILMDVQMPEIDGLQATRDIRRLESKSGRHVPIIAMTANAMKGDREACMEAGMDGYVAKPVKRDALFAEIGRLLQKGDKSHG